MSAQEMKVQCEGGWSNPVSSRDGAEFRIEISDPHTHHPLMTVSIPERTFLLMLRNTSSYRSPLGQATVYPQNIESYGYEMQRFQVALPIDPGSGFRDVFQEWVADITPRGWTCGARGYNGHHLKRRGDELVYTVGFSRVVPKDTERTCPEYPDAEITAVWYPLSEYDGEDEDQ